MIGAFRMELCREKSVLKGGMPNEGKCLIEIKYCITTNHKIERKTKMKNIFKISKRGIIAILTLCMFLITSGICVHATAIPEENTGVIEETTVATGVNTVTAVATTVVVEDTTAVSIAETTPELMPMMARECSYDSYNHYVVNGYYNNGYVKSVTVTTYYNGKVFDEYTIDYASSGSESLPTFHGCPCPMCNPKNR